VTLKDGSIIYGEVNEMVGGVLQIKTPASPDNLLLDTTLIRPGNGNPGIAYAVHPNPREEELC